MTDSEVRDFHIRNPIDHAVAVNNDFAHVVAFKFRDDPTEASEGTVQDEQQHQKILTTNAAALRGASS